MHSNYTKLTHTPSADLCFQSQIQEVLVAKGSLHDHSGEVKVHSAQWHRLLLTFAHIEVWSEVPLSLYCRIVIANLYGSRLSGRVMCPLVLTFAPTAITPKTIALRQNIGLMLLAHLL